MIEIKQSTAVINLLFLMVDSTDHVTGKTGLSPTVTLSKNGATFASPAGAVTEIANGWYQVAANATDSGTIGSLVLHATGTAADPTDKEFLIVANIESDTYALATGATGFAAIDTVVDTILVDTADMQPRVVAIETDTNELQTDDVPGLIAALDAVVDTKASQTSVDTVDGIVDTILLDTAELQGDWADGGRLDLLLDGAASAGDPWTTSLPGAYGAGTAGKIVGDNINAPIATVDTVVDAIKAVTDALPNSGALTDLATAAALTTVDNEIAALQGNVTDILTDTGTTIPGTITTIDNEIAALQSTADAIETDTQNIQSRIPATLNNGSISADVQRINDVAVTGDGSTTPFDV